MMAKIPSRKFPTAKRKIPSRPFPKSKTKIPSKKIAKGTAKIASRKFSKAPAAASKKTDGPTLIDRPKDKTTHQERLSTLKGKLKSVTTSTKGESPNVDSPPVNSKPMAMQTETIASSHFNLFADLPQQLSDELFTTLLESKNLRIERIISHGHASPDGFWYDQDHNEWVMVLKGAGRLSFEDEIVEMKPGDFASIPAHKKHRVEWTTPAETTIWLAVFYEGD